MHRRSTSYNNVNLQQKTNLVSNSWYIYSMKKLTEQELDGISKAFVTVDFVAAFLHVDRRSVCNWLSAGRLSGTRPTGGRWLIASNDLMLFVQESYTKKIPKRPRSPKTAPPLSQAASPLSQNPLANRKNKRGSK